MGENKILDEVGGRAGVDIVEDNIREKHDTVNEGGEGKMGENLRCGRALTVKGQSRRIHADSPPCPGANELKPCAL